MKTFAPVKLSLNVLSSDLSELEAFLSSTSRLNERRQVSPFFRSRPNLCAALSLTNSAVESPDRIATELDIFGDFVCDIASGDSHANAYTLIEIEDAQEYSVFSKLQKGRTMKRWAARFERGFSQLVDWAWRLSAEGESSGAFRRIFGANNPSIHLLLLVGRDSDLTRDDLARLKWRANHTVLGHFRMSCLTFDGFLKSVRRRILLARQP